MWSRKELRFVESLPAQVLAQGVHLFLARQSLASVWEALHLLGLQALLRLLMLSLSSADLFSCSAGLSLSSAAFSLCVARCVRSTTGCSLSVFLTRVTNWGKCLGGAYILTSKRGI